MRDPGPHESSDQGFTTLTARHPIQREDEHHRGSFRKASGSQYDNHSGWHPYIRVFPKGAHC